MRLWGGVGSGLRGCGWFGWQGQDQAGVVGRTNTMGRIGCFVKSMCCEEAGQG